MAKVRNQRVTIQDLKRAGVPIHSGQEYFKDWPFPFPKRKISLQRVRQILGKLPYSLAEEVARMREEDQL
jgi:hypothetical protein